MLTWTAAVFTLMALVGSPRSNADSSPPTVTQVGSRIDISGNFSPAFREASGLGLAKNETKLWSISDENFTIYKMNLDGSKAESFNPTPASGVGTISGTDFEGVTFAPPPPGSSNDHYIYLANEAAVGILPVNYDSQKYHTQKTLSSMAGYSTVQCQSGVTPASAFTGSSATESGLEGITWDGSQFFVIKEKSPGLMIRISADLTTIQECKVLSFSADYSDISYDPTRNLFWIVSDESSSLYLYNWSNNSVVQTYPLGYGNGEGVSYDPQNHRLYIVTDNGQSTDSYLYTYNVQ